MGQASQAECIASHRTHNEKPSGANHIFDIVKKGNREENETSNEHLVWYANVSTSMTTNNATQENTTERKK